MFASEFSGSDFVDGGLPITFFRIQPDKQIRQDGSRIAKEKEPLFGVQGDPEGKVEEEVVAEPHHCSQLVSLRTALLYARKLTER